MLQGFLLRLNNTLFHESYMLAPLQNAKWLLACKMIVIYSQGPNPEESKHLNDRQQCMQSSSETSPLTATHSSSFLEASKPV